MVNIYLENLYIIASLLFYTVQIFSLMKKRHVNRRGELVMGKMYTDRTPVLRSCQCHIFLEKLKMDHNVTHSLDIFA